MSKRQRLDDKNCTGTANYIEVLEVGDLTATTFSFPGSVGFNGVAPVSIGEVVAFGSTNGSQIRDTGVLYNNIVLKTGSTLTGDLVMNDKNITFTTGLCDGVDVSTLPGLITGKLNKSGDTMTGDLVMNDKNVTFTTGLVDGVDVSSLPGLITPKLNKAGDTMTGDLVMNDKNVTFTTGLVDGVDVSTLPGLISAKVSKAGDTMTGDLVMNDKNVTMTTGQFQGTLKGNVSLNNTIDTFAVSNVNFGTTNMSNLTVSRTGAVVTFKSSRVDNEGAFNCDTYQGRTATTMAIGASNSTKVEIGKSTITTEIKGDFMAHLDVFLGYGGGIGAPMTNTTSTPSNTVDYKVNFGTDIKTGPLQDFTVSSAGLITFTDARKQYLHMTCTLSFSDTKSADDTFSFFVNGVASPGSIMKLNATGGSNSGSFTSVLTLNTNDTVELYVRSSINNNVVTVSLVTFSGVALPNNVP